MLVQWKWFQITTLQAIPGTIHHQAMHQTMTKWGITNPILVQWIVRTHHRRPRRMTPSLLPRKKKVLIWIIFLTHGMESRVKLARHRQTMLARKSSQVTNRQTAKSPRTRYSTTKTTANGTGTIMAAYGLRIGSNPSMMSDWGSPRTVLLRLYDAFMPVARRTACRRCRLLRPGSRVNISGKPSRSASVLLPACRA